MFDYIEKLRAKKPHEKQVIALVSAIVVTGIISLFWIATLPYRFSSVNAASSTPDAVSQSVSQFQTLKDGFVETWNKTSGSYQAIKSDLQASWSQVK